MRDLIVSVPGIPASTPVPAHVASSQAGLATLRRF